MLNILNYFLLTAWLFWPVVSLMALVAIVVLAEGLANDEANFRPAPLALLVLVAAGLAFHFDWVHQYLGDWRAWTYGLGGYVLAGFLVSMYKWTMKALDFRRDQSVTIKNLILTTREQVEKDEPLLSKEKQANEVARIINRRDYHGKTVASVNTDGTISVCLNSESFPIASWWTYWPYFLLSVVLDPIHRLVMRLLNWLRDVYHRIARFFSVNA